MTTKTHVAEPVDTQRELRGNSRKGSDAPPEVQQKIVDIIIEEARKLQFNNRDIAYYLAIAKRESGFNPDAANAASTAAGIAQMLDATGKTYGLNNTNRFDARSNIIAGLRYFRDIKAKIAKDFGSAAGQYEALIYHCYHYGEFSVNRRETVNGNVVVKEPYPFSKLDGTPKYLDSQTVVDEAARFEKIFNDTHALQIQLKDILGKAMAGRKVIVVQKVAVPAPASTPAAAPVSTPAAAAPADGATPDTAATPPADPPAAPSSATDTAIGTTAGDASTSKETSDMCLRPPPEPSIAWEYMIKEYVTDADGNLPEVESENQDAVLVLIPRIDYEEYNKAVAEYAICEMGNAHRIETSGNEQGALPTIKAEAAPTAPAPAAPSPPAPAAAPPKPAAQAPLERIHPDWQ